MNQRFQKFKTRFLSRFSLYARILIISVVLIVFVLVLGLIFTPRIAKNYINTHGKELAGRTVRIDELKYNWFTSTLRINGFKYFEKNDTDIFISADTFMVNLRPLRLIVNEFNIQQLRIVNPHGQFIQNDTIFNFDDLITFFSSADSTETTTETTTDPLKLNLNNLELKNGSVNYTDMEIDHTFKLKEVSFLIPRILWSRLDSSNADITFKLANGGSFEGSLNYNMETSFYDGFVKIDKMEVATFLPYIQQYFKVSAIEGTASGLANFRGSVDDYNQLKVNGNFDLNNFPMFDEQNTKVLGGDYSRILMSESEPLKYKYVVDSVRLQNSYIFLALEDSLFNFEKMMVEDTTSAAESSATDETPMVFTVNHFVVENGLMNFSDKTLGETFNYELSKITIDMDTLALQDDWVNIRAAMKLNKRGNLEAKLGLNPASPLDKIALEYELTDFQLPDINIYSKHYTGLPILFGDMYYKNNTRIENKMLESDNRLIIRNVEMGRKIGGLYDVPIKLALLILKDINGDINLNIPVRGDLSDPKVKIGPIIWDTFKSFSFKIVASPFKALGQMLGINEKELEEIAFIYSDSTLTNNQQRSLDNLLKLAEMKPELQIDLLYRNDKKLERMDAASWFAQNSFKEKTGENPMLNSKDYLGFLKKETGRDSLILQDYELVFAPAAVVDSILDYREKQRFNNLFNYLQSQNDSTAIRVVGYNPSEVLNIGSRPRFEIKYTLAEDASGVQ